MAILWETPSKFAFWKATVYSIPVPSPQHIPIQGGGGSASEISGNVGHFLPMYCMSGCIGRITFVCTVYCCIAGPCIGTVGKRTQNVAVLGAHLKSVALNGKGKGKTVVHPRWSLGNNWSSLEKEEAALQLVRASLKSTKCSVVMSIPLRVLWGVGNKVC